MLTAHGIWLILLEKEKGRSMDHETCGGITGESGFKPEH